MGTLHRFMSFYLLLLFVEVIVGNAESSAESQSDYSGSADLSSESESGFSPCERLLTTQFRLGDQVGFFEIIDTLSQSTSKLNNEIIYDNPNNPTSFIDVDFDLNIILYSKDKTIFSAEININGTSNEIITTGQLIFSIAIDSNLKKLFYVNQLTRFTTSISCITYPEISMLDPVTILPDNGISIERVNDVRLDTRNRKMYWQDVSQGHIVEANYDGSSARIVIEASPLTSGLAPITFDDNSNLLYFFDGGDLKSISPESGAIQNITSSPVELRFRNIISIGNGIYGSAFFSSAIHRINATGGVFEEYLTLDVEPAGLANFCP